MEELLANEYLGIVFVIPSIAGNLLVGYSFWVSPVTFTGGLTDKRFAAIAQPHTAGEYGFLPAKKAAAPVGFSWVQVL